jgi:signal transduction histidine kinase
VTHIDEESVRLMTLIDRVLGWRRIRSGAEIYHRERVPAAKIVDLVQETASSYDKLYPGALTVDVEPDLPELEVDAVAVSDALMNLLENAFKYTGEEKRIRLGARREDGEVFFFVEDNGPGIAEEMREFVFDPFVRTSEAAEADTGGSGLGLAIVRHVARSHGGEVTVHNKLDRGSRFEMRLPALEKADR